MSSVSEVLHERPTAPVSWAAAAAEVRDLPETVIEPRRGWRSLNLGELWRYRELLCFLAWRDIKVRYKHTALGAAWAILQPFGIMLVIDLFLRRLAAPPDAVVSYPLFVFAGLLPWMFFANAVSSASQSIVGSQNLVTKVYFPRLLIPLGAIGVNLVDFAVAFGMLVAMMLYYGVVPGWGIVGAPLIAGGLVAAAVGAGALLAALTVAYRDFRYVMPFLLQFWLFATPSSYLHVDRLGESRWQALLPLNPAHGLIHNFRQAMLGGELDGWSLLVSGSVSVLLLLAGCCYFRQVEDGFADNI